MTPEYATLADKYVELERSHAELLTCLESIRNICGGDIRTHFSFDLANKVDRAITNAKRI